MKRVLRPEEARLWAKVARTAQPAPGRKAPLAPEALAAQRPPAPLLAAPSPKPVVNLDQLSAFAERGLPRPSARLVSPSAAFDLDPRRRKRIVRERDPIEDRLDLHGLDQDRARAVLERFIAAAHAEGARAVLVITGKGSTGDGVIRRFTPDWLRAPALRALIAGVSEADRRHGGEGALYVALKRNPRA